MRYAITGGAGFIGSNLVDRLLQQGHEVRAYDNFSTGRRDFLAQALKNPRFALVEGDVQNLPALTEACRGVDFVFHLAANADVRFGTEHPRRDLEENTIATFNVLEAMRGARVRRIAFSSTGSVYGESPVFPTPESAFFPVQTSLYGASKVAGEALIQAYCEGFEMQSFIFRFVSILGERYTHGHVFDFYKSLRSNPRELQVLGNGEQRKSYLYVQDCLDAMQLVIEKAREKVNIYNLGTDHFCRVNDSIGWITAHLGINPERRYSGGERGWIGDNPFIFLDTAKIRALGWQPKLSIREGIICTLEYLQANPWLLEARVNVVVQGLWHLGCVTAGCLAAAGHRVVGLDFDADIVRLRSGRAPLFEPGLDALLAAELRAERLFITNDASEALQDADVLWVAYDTPVDDDDVADVPYVLDRVRRSFPHLPDGAVVLISSQMPVGSTAELEREYAAAFPERRVSFACSPENLRLGKALDVFQHPDRVVVGVRDDVARRRIAALLAPFAAPIEWMTVESAEMVKHALNAFLAVSVTYANEIATLCEAVGADAKEVERGLKSEARIGPKAYLSPGTAFAGGTLARDVAFLNAISSRMGRPMQLLAAVKKSNDAHRRWTCNKLQELLGDCRGRTVAVWGLTYKPGTSTLRRSSAVELCHWLVAQGAAVRTHDPAIGELPAELPGEVRHCTDPLQTASGADALVLATPWPDYQTVSARDIASVMAQPRVIDPTRFLAAALVDEPRIQYSTIGRRAA